MLTVMSTVSFCDPFTLTFKERRGKDTFILTYSKSACLALALMKTRYCTTINNQSLSTTINHMNAVINFLNTLRLCLVCFFKGSTLSVLIRQLNSKINTYGILFKTFLMFCCKLCMSIDKRSQKLTHTFPHGPEFVELVKQKLGSTRLPFVPTPPQLDLRPHTPISTLSMRTILNVRRGDTKIASLECNFLIKNSSLFIL